MCWFILFRKAHLDLLMKRKILSFTPRKEVPILTRLAGKNARAAIRWRRRQLLERGGKIRWRLRVCVFFCTPFPNTTRPSCCWMENESAGIGTEETFSFFLSFFFLNSVVGWWATKRKTGSLLTRYRGTSHCSARTNGALPSPPTSRVEYISSGTRWRPGWMTTASSNRFSTL